LLETEFKLTKLCVIIFLLLLGTSSSSFALQIPGSPTPVQSGSSAVMLTSPAAVADQNTGVLPALSPSQQSTNLADITSLFSETGII